MATSKSQITDGVVASINGEVVDGDPADLEPGADVKGPDPDRLANHAAEVEAHAARLREESKAEE